MPGCHRNPTLLAIYLQRLFSSASGFNMIEAFISLAFAVAANAIIFLIVFMCHVFYLTPKYINEAAAAKILATEQRARETPKIEVACDLKFEGCTTSHIWPCAGRGVPVRFWHLAVWTAGSSSIRNCRAFLTRITKNGKKIWNGQEQLTFSPSQAADSLSKTLHNKVISFVDLIVVRSDTGDIHICNKTRQWFRHPSLNQIFAESGEYELIVAVTADDVLTKTCQLKFEKTGNWQTSFLTLTGTD